MDEEKFKDLKEASWEDEIILFLEDNEIRTEKDLPLTFDNHRFLIDIYNDWSPILTCRKGSQIGFSTMYILKTKHAARYKGWNIIYTLPTFSDVLQFVSSKVDLLIANNPVLNKWVRKNTTFLKQIYKRFIYYRGTFSKKSEKEKMESGVGIMLTSDWNIHDESDRSDQTILEQYESRLEASKFAGRHYFSNPTVPGTLTQKLWAKSDQKHWFVKCPRCNYLQWLDYYKNVCHKREIFICQKCKREITDDTRRNGFWVKRYRNNKDVSGYWINHLMAPWKTAKQLINTEKTSTKQYFLNFVLGLPYKGSDVVVDAELILKNIVYGQPNFKVNNVIGVDTGLHMHYVLGNKQGVFKTGVTDDWDEIEFLMKKYNALAVFDALGDLTKPRQLRDKYRGKVWLCYFKRDKDSPEAVKWDTKTMAVYADRSKIIQRVIDEFVDGQIKFYLEPDKLIEYIEHWETLYQLEETDSIGVKRKVWQTDGKNHLLFSTIYFYLGLSRAGSGHGVSWEPESKIEKAHDPSTPDIQEELERQRFEGEDWRT